MLEDLGLRKATRQRYLSQLLRILPVLEEQQGEVDDIIAEFVQEQFSEGASLGSVGDTLCAIHHFLPWLKGKLHKPWKLFKIWKRCEEVQQATPLPQQVLDAMAFRAVELGQLRMAALLTAGFYGLLRTGEMLTLRMSSILVNCSRIIMNLGYTKTGFRTGTEEIVVVDHPRTVLIWKLVADLLSPTERIWNGTGSEFRREFDALLTFFGISEYGFRPYSLRRGGATALFHHSNNMEKVLVLGRWKTSASAKQYINQGVATLASVRFSNATAALVMSYSCKFDAPN